MFIFFHGSATTTLTPPFGSSSVADASPEYFGPILHFPQVNCFKMGGIRPTQILGSSNSDSSTSMLPITSANVGF